MRNWSRGGVQRKLCVSTFLHVFFENEKNFKLHCGPPRDQFCHPNCDGKLAPLRNILTGVTISFQFAFFEKNFVIFQPGGCGKTFFINALVEVVTLLYGQGSILPSASTGIAASHISGCTLHSLLKLSVHHGEKLEKKCTLLSEEAAHCLRVGLGKLRLLIVDEVLYLSKMSNSFFKKLCLLF